MGTIILAQSSSTYYKFNPKFFFYDKTDNSSDYNFLSNYKLNYQAQITNISKTAQKPTFINSELSLNDGTYWRTNSDINFLKLSSILGAMATADLIAYMYQREVWYKEETTVFHTLDFTNDWNI